MSKEDTKTKNISLSLVAIIQDIGAIAKDQKNESQGFRFRGIDSIFNALHPIFAAHGVLCVPCTKSLAQAEMVNSKGNKVFRSTVTVIYRFTSADGSTLDAEVIGDAFDSADKSLPKAYSMALKTLMTEMFLIPTADLADADNYDYTIDAASELKKTVGTEYDGMTHAQLVSIRTGIMNSGQVPPALLLGKIAEAKAAEDEANTALGPQKGGIATKTEEKAPETAPAVPRKAKQTKATQPELPKTPEPAQAEAEPIETTATEVDLEGEDEPKKEDPLNHVIQALKHKDFIGKKVGSLSREAVDTAVASWVLNPKNKDTIANDPVRQKDAWAFLEAKKMWDAQPK